MTPQDDASGSINRRTLLKRGGQSAVLLGLGTVAFAGTATASACPRTPGFWKTHRDAWHPNFPGGMNSDTKTFDGVTYTADDFYNILNTKPKGDKTLKMAHHWIAYKLSTYDSKRSCFEYLGTDNDYDTMAQEWLDEYGIGTGMTDWMGGEEIKDALDAYTNGLVELGCECDPYEGGPDANSRAR